MKLQQIHVCDGVAKIIRLLDSAINILMSLNTLDDALKIKDLLDSDRIHKTKETLVLTYGVVGNGGSFQTILTLPSCSKMESDQFSCMIDATSRTSKIPGQNTRFKGKSL